jgi:hypothetical protein
MSNRLSKTILLLVILSAATAVWIPRQRALAQTRAVLAETKARALKFDERINAATAQLESVRAEVKAQTASRKEARSAIAKAEADLAKIDPESRWTTAPPNLPNWNSDSPYVWLRKDIIPQLPITAFEENGELNPNVAYVLTLDEKQATALNRTLTKILADYRALEATKAEKTDEHLPGIAGQDGDKLTIRVQPQAAEGKQYMQQFQAAFRNELGSQRAGLLLQVADNWFDQQFSQSATAPKAISLLRCPDGSYSISIKSGNSWQSTGGPWRIAQLWIPPHLRPMFSDIAPPPTDQASP